MIDHPNEQTLNMYLDEELSSDEHQRVDAHLANCDICRAEIDALRGLFTALDELTLASEPAPNLTPGVLARIHPRRQPTDMKLRSGLWIIPALQGAIALALLAWGWARLADYWALAREFLPLDLLRNTQALLSSQTTAIWTTLSGWMMALWTAMTAWPGALWNGLQEWIARASTLGSLPFSLAQLALLGASLAVFWLVSNAVLLSRAFLNGHIVHKEALK